jgi:4,5-dihydroxyphthalate decarboxylase
MYVGSGELEPLHRRVAEITGGDPLPYGVEPNRGAIEELLDHALAQRILSRRPNLDQLFAVS